MRVETKGTLDWCSWFIYLVVVNLLSNTPQTRSSLYLWLMNRLISLRIALHGWYTRRQKSNLPHFEYRRLDQRFSLTYCHLLSLAYSMHLQLLDYVAFICLHHVSRPNLWFHSHAPFFHPWLSPSFFFGGGSGTLMAWASHRRGCGSSSSLLAGYRALQTHDITNLASYHPKLTRFKKKTLFERKSIVC